MTTAPSPQPAGLGARIWRGADGAVRPLWIAVMFAVLAPVVQYALLAVFALLQLPIFAYPDSWGVLVSTIPTLVGALTASFVLHRRFGEATNLEDAHALRGLGLGLLLGAVQLTLAVGVPALLGKTWLVRGNGTVWDGVRQLVVLAPAGFGEELLMRGLGFRAAQRSIGTTATVLLSGVLIGVLHLGNPNATWQGAAFISLDGIWFGVLVVLTRSVWLTVGLHVGWNFFQGFVFGLPVSGQVLGGSLWRGSVLGEPSFWHGGFFGPEASGFAACVTGVALVITLLIARRRRLT